MLPSMLNLSLDDIWAFSGKIDPGSTEHVLQSWLVEHGIFDKGMTHTAMEEGYARFYCSMLGWYQKSIGLVCTVNCLNCNMQLLAGRHI